MVHRWYGSHKYISKLLDSRACLAILLGNGCVLHGRGTSLMFSKNRTEPNDRIKVVQRWNWCNNLNDISCILLDWRLVCFGAVCVLAHVCEYALAYYLFAFIISTANIYWLERACVVSIKESMLSPSNPYVPYDLLKLVPNRIHWWKCTEKLYVSLYEFNSFSGDFRRISSFSLLSSTNYTSTDEILWELMSSSLLER